MVKAAEAIEAIEAETGIPRVTIERAAYILRRADGDLFPTGGRGGGTAAPRPTVPHLVNLVLAIYAADPLNEAPELVRRYRDLVPAPPNRLWMLAKLGSGFDVWARSEKYVSDVLDLLCPGATLGDMLDGLVRHLMSAEYPMMRAERRAFARQNLTSFSVWHHRFRGGAIGASLITPIGTRSFREPVGGLLPLMEEGLEDRGIPAAAAMDIVAIPSAIFEILADLALDTERAHGHKPSSDAPGGPDAKDAKTTTPTRRTAGPAPVDDKESQPSCHSAIGGGSGLGHQDSGRKKRGQCPPPFEPPGSPSSDDLEQSKDEPPWPISNLRMQSAG
jgi:hypothetical protein